MGNISNASASRSGETAAPEVIIDRIAVSGLRPRRFHSSSSMSVIEGTRKANVAESANSSQARSAEKLGMIRTWPPMSQVARAKLE